MTSRKTVVLYTPGLPPASVKEAIKQELAARGVEADVLHIGDSRALPKGLKVDVLAGFSAGCHRVRDQLEGLANVGDIAAPGVRQRERPVLAREKLQAEPRLAVTLSADKDAYAPGETATLLIQSPFQTARALVVTEQPDGMIIEGPTKVSPTKSIRSYGDHRVAMSLSILAIFADAPTTIANVACVDTSYPEFWEQLSQLGVNVE